jgi:PPK2 family polyphosphate:nucleotide phosphotransferase
MMDYREKFLVEPDRRLQLSKIDTGFSGGALTEETAKVAIERCRAKLTRQQALIYAQRKHSVVVVLQALDAGGKDGTIKHVFSCMNPQGTTVAGFKQPTTLESSHDFLWRVHARAPARGEVAIFNRSHYEDVIVTRVHKTIDKAECAHRYEQIRAFEDLLISSGALVLKFFLHISREEQLARFAERLEDPHRNWKISEADYAERASWDRYVDAFEAALSATSTAKAPWYVIPANHKWFRNLAVSEIMVSALEELKLSFPEPSVDLDDIRKKYHAALESERKGKKRMRA